MRMKVLFTGAAGGIGRNLRGCYDLLRPSHSANLDPAGLSEETHRADLESLDEARKAVGKQSFHGGLFCALEFSGHRGLIG